MYGRSFRTPEPRIALFKALLSCHFFGMSEDSRDQFDGLCAAAVQYGASDILLHEGRVPQLRIAGKLVPLETSPTDLAFFDTLWKACHAEFSALDVDTSITSSEGVRFRVNLLHQLGLRAAVLRRIRSDVPDISSLGLPEKLLCDWADRRSGIVLVCGPTGSGKSTTLAAMLEWINQNHVRHVVTIEDPVEYIFTNKNSLFTQREVGIDTPDFAEGLRRSLRQNPDVILVGEIRDAVTATTAIQASETGHLVLATLHSSSSADAIERLQLFFSTEGRDSVRRTLSDQLLGILCQRLLPAAAEGKLVLATEYFTNIAATRKYISEGRLDELQDLVARGDGQTAINFLNTLTKLVRSGQISEEVAYSVSENPQELRRALRGITSSTSRR